MLEFLLLSTNLKVFLSLSDELRRTHIYLQKAGPTGQVIPEHIVEGRQPTHSPSLWQDQGAFLPVGKAKVIISPERRMEKCGKVSTDYDNTMGISLPPQ